MVTQAPEKVKVCDAAAHLLLFFAAPNFPRFFMTPTHRHKHYGNMCKWKPVQRFST